MVATLLDMLLPPQLCSEAGEDVKCNVKVTGYILREARGTNAN